MPAAGDEVCCIETCDEALAAIARPAVASVQIILNAFRRKPLERVLPATQAAGVGIIARVPLASGLLSGKYDEPTTFAADDHRTYNRAGRGVRRRRDLLRRPFRRRPGGGPRAARRIPPGVATAQFALRWIVDQPGVTTVIPGARNAEQARGNAAAADLAPLTDEQQAAVREVYDRHIRSHVQDRW